jgi:hypothetical protein
MEQNTNLDIQILSRFYDHINQVAVSRKCIQKVFSNNSSNSTLNKQLYNECFNSRMQLLLLLDRKRNQKSDN